MLNQLRGIGSLEIGTDLSFYRIPIYVSRVFSNKEFIRTFENFFRQYNTPGLERSINQGIEAIKWQYRWKDASLTDLISYLKKKYF